MTELFSVFITSKAALDLITRGLNLRSVLVHKAYDQWLRQHPEQTEFWQDSWTGHVEVVSGGYRVWIEEEPGSPAAEVLVSIPVGMIEHANVLMDELRDDAKQLSELGIDEWPVVAHIDEQRSVTIAELADEYMDLLVGSGLAQPLVEEENDETT